MKKTWKALYGFRDGNGYREEFLYVNGSNISVALKNATNVLDGRKINGLIDAYMITDIGLVGDPDKEVC